MNTTVQTSGITDLVSVLSGATDDTVSATANRILSSARKLKASLDALAVDDRYESRGSEVAVQAQNMQDAIDTLTAAQDRESKIAAMVYLKSTIEVSNDFYLESPPAHDAIEQFRNETMAAMAKVIGGVAGGITNVASTAVNAALDGFLGRWKWPVLIMFLGILVVVLVSKGKVLTHA